MKHDFDKRIENLKKEFKDTHALLAKTELEKQKQGEINNEFWRQLLNASKSFHQMIGDLNETESMLNQSLGWHNILK